MFCRRLLIPLRSITTSAVREADLLQEAYLKQLRDLNSKQKAAGGDLLASSPEYKKEFQDQLNRLAKKFQMESADAVTKLALNFEKPVVQSSVSAFSPDGKPVNQLMEELKTAKKEYDQEQSDKKRAERELRAKMGAEEDEGFLPFPMPLKDVPKQVPPQPSPPKKPAIAG